MSLTPLLVHGVTYHPQSPHVRRRPILNLGGVGLWGEEGYSAKLLVDDVPEEELGGGPVDEFEGA